MSGWPTLPLGDICAIRSGNSNTQDAVPDGEYIFFDRSKTPKRSGRYLFDCEAIIIAGEGAEFRPKRYHGKFDLHQRAYAIYGFGERILGDYLFYYLEHVHEYFQQVAVGATVRSLRQRHFEHLPVILPPLEEQRRIVAVLDEAFADIATATANTETNLANARELFENALGAVFADLATSAPVRSIGEIAEIKGGKRVPKGYKLLEEPTPFPYLTVGDFTDDGTIDPSGIRYVSKEIHVQIRRYIVRSKDLYVSIAGTIGRTGIVPPELDGAQLTENACRLVFKDDISNEFVYFFTKSGAFRVQAIEQTRTAAQPKLALSRLEQIRLPVPDPSTQNALVGRFSELRDATAQLSEQASRKREALAALKQSLLHRAFSGELTEREPLAA